MKYVNAKGRSLSAFTLGTVQLGMTYGLGTDRAKPSEETAFGILDVAMENGINTLDTANDYGDSEAIIGRWMAKRKAQQKEVPMVVTKISSFRDDSPDVLRDDILRQTEACLKNLGVDTLDCLMLHNFNEYEKHRDIIRKTMEEIKAQKLCNWTALSAYSFHDYGVIAETGFDATQIPLNVFDWGQIENGGIQKIADSGMMIFVRSVFLQGLVFHTPEDLDPRMDFCGPYLDKYLQLCKEFELTPDVLALSYVLSVPGVTTAVMGCDTAKHVQANCSLFDKTVKLTDDQLKKLHDAFYNIDPRVINPSLWFNHT